MFNGEERIILTVTVFVYFIFLFVLALYMNRKTKTYEDYNVAGRSVGLFPIMLTFIGTGVGGSTLLGYMENGYRLGMGRAVDQYHHALFYHNFCFILIETSEEAWRST